MDHAPYPQHPRTPFQKTEAVKRQIAFFDFDGTLTTRDTLLEFIRFSKGDLRFYLGFLLNSPWLFAYKLKLISNQAAKERMLTWFFRNQPLASFQAACDRFAATAIPRLLRPKGLHEIAQLQGKGVAVFIVSASPGDWIRPWSDSIGAGLIATRLQLQPAFSDHECNQEPRLTGRIDGKNCHGPEKVRRIREEFPADDFDILYAYGDSRGDRPMLALAHHAFMKPFR